MFRRPESSLTGCVLRQLDIARLFQKADTDPAINELNLAQDGERFDDRFRYFSVVVRIFFEHTDQNWQRSTSYFLFSHVTVRNTFN